MTVEAIDATLHQLIPKDGSPLFDGACYSLSGGKRLRPLLLLATLESAALPIEQGLLPACALEMVHTYSLIHDDLPCMDDDNLRRGRPTLHTVYSESHALLVGDFLLTYAFETLSRAPQLPCDKKLELIRTLSESAGSCGMIGGQLLDITKAANWKHIHRMKTGALIQWALVCGGIIADLPLEPLKALGQSLGMAYQLVDDLLDGDGAVAREGRSWVEGEINRLDRQIERLLPTCCTNLRPLSDMKDRMIYRKV